MTQLLPIDNAIYQTFAIRCAEGGWLRVPPQYRTDAECEAERVMDAERDLIATRNWASYRKLGLSPAAIVAAQTA